MLRGLILCLLLTGCVYEHAYYRNPPDVETLNSIGGWHLFHKLDAPILCGDTKKFYMDESNVIADRYRTVGNSHFIVWDFRDDCPEMFEGGLTRHVVAGRIVFANQVSYMGWDIANDVPGEQLRIVLHELRHQAGEEHCNVASTFPCID